MNLPEGIDSAAFEEAMRQPPSVSLKLNRRKCSNPADLGYGQLQTVSWCPSGYYLDERPVFTLNPLLHAGVFYVQDASSMIYETIVSRLLELHLIPESPVVLDLCAAPGGKTTSMINALPDSSFVVANEVMPKRVRILQENLAKWGYPDVMVTNSQVSAFISLGERFDLVAVDAPCSGEGMMRKDPDAVRQWSPGLVAQCASLQREILADAVRLIKPGGIMIYSTCTFNRTENEENVAFLVEDLGLVPLDLKWLEEWGIGSQLDSPYPAMRFMPHITRGEGLFVAVVQKPVGADGGSQEITKEKLAAIIRKKLRVIGNDEEKSDTAKPKHDRISKKEKVIDRPDPLLPLRTDFVHDSFPTVSLSADEALAYLRHEALRLPDSAPKGYVVVTFQGHPLGFVKNLGNRANNLYPSQWKIRIK